MPGAVALRKLIEFLSPERLVALGEQHPELLERLGERAASCCPSWRSTES